MIEVTEEMSGGLRHQMMRKTGRAMWLDTNHRSKIITLSKGNSASALTERCVQSHEIKKPKSLDTTGVVRDVENRRLHKLAPFVRLFKASMRAIGVKKRQSLCRTTEAFAVLG
ncbi:MAG TPA: hypothetical protein VG498_21700 [Terriglobales bacterium]|nr:hypothetical protein [Terriglobales bacterium]